MYAALVAIINPARGRGSELTQQSNYILFPKCASKIITPQHENQRPPEKLVRLQVYDFKLHAKRPKVCTAINLCRSNLLIDNPLLIWKFNPTTQRTITTWALPVNKIRKEFAREKKNPPHLKPRARAEKLPKLISLSSFAVFDKSFLNLAPFK